MTHIQSDKPVVGFGAMGLSYHRGPTNDEESLATLAKAVELGCTFWDTASVYGYGHNEELIGRFIKESGVPRDSLFIGSKCGHVIDFEARKSLGRDTNARDHIIEYLEGSTARLGSAPDLYYLHRMDPDTDLQESIGTLAEMRESGKCRFIGLCECSADTLRKACSIAKIDYLQIEYSPWCIDHATDGVIDAAKELGVQVVAYSPLGRGVLTGKYRDAALFAGPNDNRGGLPKYSADNLGANLQLVDKLEEIAQGKGCTVSQLCIAWILHQGFIPIPGTKKVERLVENYGSESVAISDKEMKELDELIRRLKPKGDRYDQEQMTKLGH